MSRNTNMLMCAAFLLFASAVVVFCVSEDMYSDAAGPEPMPWDPSMDLRMEQCPSPPGPGMPPAMGPSMMMDVPPQDPPRYVIDAPDRPQGDLGTASRIQGVRSARFRHKRLKSGPYELSYNAIIWSHPRDSNPRSPVYKTGTLNRAGLGWPQTLHYIV